MTSSAAKRARHVLNILAMPHAGVAAIPGRRSDRQVFRATCHDGPALYLKVFDRVADYEREARAYATVDADLAAPLVATIATARTVVTQEVKGVAGPGLPPQRHLHLLRHAVLAFERLLSAKVRAPIDPIAYPTGPRFEQYIQRLALDTPDMASSFDQQAWDAQPLLPCHGDLTPNNIIVSEAGTKLIDFEFYGISQPLHDAASLCLSPTLVIPKAARVSALLTCAGAVASATGQLVSTTTLACAAGIWAVRFAARLHDDPPDLDAQLTPDNPLRIATDVLSVLERSPLRQDLNLRHLPRTVP